MLIDDIVVKINLSGYRCRLRQICMEIVLYADYVVLVAPSLLGLQRLVHLSEDELKFLDKRNIPKKTLCLRIGSRCDKMCKSIVTRSNSDFENYQLYLETINFTKFRYQV